MTKPEEVYEISWLGTGMVSRTTTLAGQRLKTHGQQNYNTWFITRAQTLGYPDWTRDAANLACFWAASEATLDR